VHILRYVPPDADRWLSRAVVETVTIRRRELLVRSPEFPAIYHITTEPYGATVLVNGLAAGTTPLDLRPGSVREPVTVTKDGYDDVSVSLAGAERQVHLLLHPRSGSPADPQSLYLSREQTKGSFPIVLTAGATVLTGAAAAYFKIKADNSYDDYRRNGTEASLSQVRALDVASGISLAASELGLFTLSYFLLSR
jgi:hypothetical protein